MNIRNTTVYVKVVAMGSFILYVLCHSEKKSKKENKDSMLAFSWSSVTGSGQ